MAHNLNPGNPGTVLISGLPAGTGGTIFDGTFSVTSVIDAFTFTYSQTAADDTTSSTTASPGTVSFGLAFLTYSLTPTIQGIAINPITRTAVFADPNAQFQRRSPLSIRWTNRFSPFRYFRKPRALSAAAFLLNQELRK